MPQAETNVLVNNLDRMYVRTSGITDLPPAGFTDGTTVLASAWPFQGEHGARKEGRAATQCRREDVCAPACAQPRSTLL